MRRVGAVDCGTNSIRLLVADLAADGGSLTEVTRTMQIVRLGEGIDATGRISEAAMTRTLAAAEGYAAMCREAGCDSVRFVATSASRDAENAGDFVAGVREAFAGFDVSPEVVSGQEEAELSFLGATVGLRAGGASGPYLVVDIGGGSTELIVGNGREISFHDSLQIGVVRHTERHIASDPPTAGEMEALAADVRGLIEDSVGSGIEARHGIAVAGTPTSLAAVELGLEPYDPSRVHGHVLALPSIQRMLSSLASVPLAERVEIPGLHPDRAPNIVAGVVILVETMRSFGLEQITVSEHDILYGTALAAGNHR